MKKILAILVAIVGIVLLVSYYEWGYSSEPLTCFRTVKIERGDVVSTITATGTVQPEDVIDVGAQVAGMVLSLGPDPRGLPDSTSPEKEKFKNRTIDYCTPVKQGDLLALIDKSVYEAQRDQAQANLKRSKAELEQMKAKLAQTEQDWIRAQTLLPKDAIAKNDYDLAQATYMMAKANVSVGEAIIQQNEAALRMAERNLGFTEIRSPVDGVIIARRVNVGQTVVASLNAPSLFLIAKNLRKMEVWALVNEADIGRINDHQNMSVRFKVDAYPNEIFHGRIDQIRYNASVTQNVVLYTVVVSFDNPDLKVLPYMTANFLFDVERSEKVLNVANTALRWKPKLEQVVPELQESVAPLLSEKTNEKSDSKGSGSEGKTPAQKAAAMFSKPRSQEGRLWVKDGDFVRPIEVQRGITDNSVTEVRGSELKEGMEVVVGEISPEEDEQGTNPFMPKIFRRRP